MYQLESLFIWFCWKGINQSIDDTFMLESSNKSIKNYLKTENVTFEIS